jgi:hypothetical protein
VLSMPTIGHRSRGDATDCGVVLPKPRAGVCAKPHV